MSQVIRQDTDGRWSFHCPGCGFSHSINSGWQFDGNLIKPTISPSILVRGVVPTTDEELDRMAAGEAVTPKPLRCHSFVRNGNIEFLSDCSHSLAGQTVPLEAF